MRLTKPLEKLVWRGIDPFMDDFSDAGHLQPGAQRINLNLYPASSRTLISCLYTVSDAPANFCSGAHIANLAVATATQRAPSFEKTGGGLLIRRKTEWTLTSRYTALEFSELWHYLATHDVQPWMFEDSGSDGGPAGFLHAQTQYLCQIYDFSLLHHLAEAYQIERRFFMYNIAHQVALDIELRQPDVNDFALSVEQAAAQDNIVQRSRPFPIVRMWFDRSFQPDMSSVHPSAGEVQIDFTDFPTVSQDLVRRLYTTPPNSPTSFVTTASSEVTLVALSVGLNAAITAGRMEPPPAWEFEKLWYQLSRHDLRPDHFSTVSGHPSGMIQQEIEFLRNIKLFQQKAEVAGGSTGGQSNLTGGRWYSCGWAVHHDSRALREILLAGATRLEDFPLIYHPLLQPASACAFCLAVGRPIFVTAILLNGSLSGTAAVHFWVNSVRVRQAVLYQEFPFAKSQPFLPAVNPAQLMQLDAYAAAVPDVFQRILTFDIDLEEDDTIRLLLRTQDDIRVIFSLLLDCLYHNRPQRLAGLIREWLDIVTFDQKSAGGILAI
ncbi:hypothetical protein K438DRAFT_1772218 [Mycena galopus ATCC 62051]|nr:hypothetical protein K438DRAFT_1772218 [Mycena galopus ATCC 62051]